MVTLKDGSTVEDPRLGRLKAWDSRNENYLIRPLLAAQGITAPRTYSWGCYAHLDQGAEGACVGFATEHELAANPKSVAMRTNKTALLRYHRAQHLDPWPGCYLGKNCTIEPMDGPYDGTAVIAGVQAAQADGFYSEYRWATGVDDLASAVSWKGPAILGIDWYDGMYSPRQRADGRYFIHREGEIAGGHAIMCVGYNVSIKAFRLHNSWGLDWGTRSRAWISKADMADLLASGGEACIPIVR